MTHFILTLDSKNMIVSPEQLLLKQETDITRVEYTTRLKEIIGENKVVVNCSCYDLLNKNFNCVIERENIQDTRYILGSYNITFNENADILHIIRLTEGSYYTEGLFAMYDKFVMFGRNDKMSAAVHEQYIKTELGEMQYLNLMSDILKNGDNRIGRNGVTMSMFGKHMKFDLRNGFPLLTTKKMFFRGIVEELLFFLRGDTDSKILEEKKINIWKGNTSKEFLEDRGLNYEPGIMGPMYGYQWRRFGATYGTVDKGIDQLANVINLIKNDPGSRRIIMTDYNPSQAEEGVLYPCHSIIIQFYVQNNFLDMFCYNRSQDVLLGVPFNIASSALLQIIIANITGLTPRFFNLSMGDSHIYDSHISAVREQICRVPYVFPQLELHKLNDISDIEKLKYNDFILSGYIYHPSIKAEMIA